MDSFITVVVSVFSGRFASNCESEISRRFTMSLMCTFPGLLRGLLRDVELRQNVSRKRVVDNFIFPVICQHCRVLEECLFWEIIIDLKFLFIFTSITFECSLWSAIIFQRLTSEQKWDSLINHWPRSSLLCRHCSRRTPREYLKWDAEKRVFRCRNECWSTISGPG